MSPESDPTRYRPLLFSIAYRMVGSVQDAEDLVQEAFLRWADVDEARVHSPKDFLSTTVTRLAIDHLRSARVRREAYVGAWLPEPLLADPVGDPAETAVLHESLSTAFLLVLESLSPDARAVFLLRQVFGYEYADVARIVGKSEANCRQMLHRAQHHLAERRPRFEADQAQAESLAERFLAACHAGNLDGLISLLAADANAWADGGGKVRAARESVHGAERVGRYMLGVVNKVSGAVYTLVRAGGQLGVVAYAEGRPIAVITFGIAGGRINDLFLVVNPEKLRAVPPLL